MFQTSPPPPLPPNIFRFPSPPPPPPLVAPPLEREFSCNFILFVLLRDYFLKVVQLLQKQRITARTILVAEGVAFKLRNRVKNSPSCVLVLHKILNFVISRCSFGKDGKVMCQNLKRTRVQSDCFCSLERFS